MSGRSRSFWWPFFSGSTGLSDSSAGPGRRILLLSVRALAFLAIFFALWALSLPLYNRALAGALNRVLPVLESPPLTESVESRTIEGRPSFVIRCKALERPFVFHGDFHFGNVLFAALLFASLPYVPLSRRLLLLGGGGAVLFLVNLLQFFFYVQTYYAMPGNAGPILANSFAYPRGLPGWFGLAPRDFFNYGAAVLQLGERLVPVLLWMFVHFAHRRPASPTLPAR